MDTPNISFRPQKINKWIYDEVNRNAIINVALKEYYERLYGEKKVAPLDMEKYGEYLRVMNNGKEFFEINGIKYNKYTALKMLGLDQFTKNG